MCHQVLNRVSLHHYTSRSEKMDCAQISRESLTHSFCQELFLSSLSSHAKREAFNKLWTPVMAGMVHQALISFSNLDQEMKELLYSL